MTASVDRQRLHVTVSDDGRGLDLAASREQLARRGHIVPESEQAVAEAIFQPGFSTSEAVTTISGRGVGLDAVRTAMARIRGSVRVDWTTGKGMTFSLECPPSLATLRAVLVTIASQTLAIPSANIEGLLRIRPSDIHRADGRDVILGDKVPIPIVALASLLGPGLPDPSASEHFPVVKLQVGGRRIALIVEALLAEVELVLRPVERLRNPPAYLGGAALLPSGEVALVMNSAELISAGLTAGSPRALRADASQEESKRRRILVVDDSITTRTLEQSILQAEGFDVLTAVDGAEGWQLLQEHAVDLVVSDVEMPRMDGFELCRAIRASRQLTGLPVILVTGLESAEHRERGLEAGADAYLPKSSFDQQGLLDTIEQLLG